VVSRAYDERREAGLLGTREALDAVAVRADRDDLGAVVR
jgi:hypothetical protein